ncbi:hypothetical protein J6590_014302 [Homalodisca vitripennis]|nr:hypothetical protein J6590_014302 [Homalodisca vitripennis]
MPGFVIIHQQQSNLPTPPRTERLRATVQLSCAALSRRKLHARLSLTGFATLFYACFSTSNVVLPERWTVPLKAVVIEQSQWCTDRLIRGSIKLLATTV